MLVGALLGEGNKSSTLRGKRNPTFSLEGASCQEQGLAAKMVSLRGRRRRSIFISKRLRRDRRGVDCYGGASRRETLASVFCGDFYILVRARVWTAAAAADVVSLQGEGLRAATSPFVDRLGPTSRDKWSMPLSQHAVRLSIMYPCRLRSRHRLSRWRSPPYNGSAILSSKEKPHPDPMQNTRGVFFSRASNFQDGVSIQLTDEARVFPAACCA